MTKNASTAPPRPRALLLDFGGVVITTRKRPGGRDAGAAHLHSVLERARIDVSLESLRDSLEAGLTALTHWKHASSRRREPRELTHREIVGDFLASSLPDDARAALTAEASEILDVLQTLLTDHVERPGIRRTLDLARHHGLPVGIVSNAHSGRSHRRILADLGLDERMAVQVYSDEVGMRKPHPHMLTLAATALGVAPEDCWYVGDTLDRDVVAGRRAGVGHLVITRDKHTDAPPFAVDHAPDAMHDTPEGLADALAAALAVPAAPQRVDSPRQPHVTPEPRPALLIDHGGVISTSHPAPDAMVALGQRLSALLSTPEQPLEPGDAIARIAHARSLRASAKDGSLEETRPEQFWFDLFGGDLDDRARALLRAEAAPLMHAYGRAKSRRSVRTGIRDLLEHCADQGMPVVIVSNTLSGRAVRDACADHGLADLIGAYVCSDEVGVRKPHPRIVAQALTVASADPARTWFYGDKPHADAAVARDAGIARRVLARGGAVGDGPLDDAVRSGLATDVVEDARGLLDLLRQHTLAPALS